MTSPSTQAQRTKYVRPPVPLHFPEEEQVPESKRHLDQRTALYQIFQLAFGERALIGSDQFVYWDPTDPRQCLAPDVFLRWGAPDEPFGSWKVWERGAPDVAVEILSASDERDRDWNEKLERYRRLGVRELVCFDRNANPPTLRVWDAIDGDLVERQLDEPTAPSHCLPGNWVIVSDPVHGRALRLAQLEAGTLFPTPAEHERELAQRQRELAEHERERRIAAEQRILELEAELRRRDADG
ncbi:MAG: Uma2 family endonuclease [Myxococcota bacterium]|nr:Uma2 family endonuclease [Myxococcota bacterium]